MSTTLDPDSTDSPDSGLDKTTIFTLLQNPRRRAVLELLDDHGGAVSIRELSEQIGATENDVPVDRLEYDQRKRVYVSLYQTHLPKLDEAGVVDYDRRDGMVQLADRADDCLEYIDVEDDERDASDGARTAVSWDAVFVGLAVLFGGSLALGAAGLGPFALLPAPVLAAVVIGVFGFVSGVRLVVNARD